MSPLPRFRIGDYVEIHSFNNSPRYPLGRHIRLPHPARVVRKLSGGLCRVSFFAKKMGQGDLPPWQTDTEHVLLWMDPRDLRHASNRRLEED